MRTIANAKFAILLNLAEGNTAGPRFMRDLTYTTYTFATSPPSLHVAAPRLLSRNLWRSTMNYSRSRARLSENFIIEVFHYLSFSLVTSHISR